MVKAKTKKKKKKVKPEPARDMFITGGLNLLFLGGFIGIFYHTLYLLISVETHVEESVILISDIFYGLGMLCLFFGIIFVSYTFLKETEHLKKYTGSFLVAGGILSFLPVVYSQYDKIIGLKEQTIALQSFVTLHASTIMVNLGKLYFFAGVICVGMYLWGRRQQRSWAAAFFISGVVCVCVNLVISIYNSYDTYKMFMEMYATSRDLIISQFLFPDLLNIISRLLVVIGVLLLSVFYLSKYRLKKWTGRIWVFGGAVGVFHWFLRLSLDSQTIHNEITGVRQSIMQLTPYSTSLKDLPLTIETLREFYVKKMIPLYLEDGLWIIVFAGIALMGIYFWVRE